MNSYLSKNLQDYSFKTGKKLNGLDKILPDQKEYKTLIDLAPEVIYSISADGKLEMLSKAFENLTGWKIDEWIGKSFLGLIHTEDLPLAIEKFKEGMDGKSSSTYELRILSKSGDFLTGEFTSIPRYFRGKLVGKIGVARDITERKKLQKQLQETKDQLVAIFSQVDHGITVQDPSGKIILANNAAAKLCGFKDAETFLKTPTEEIVKKFELLDDLGKIFPLERLPSRQALKGKSTAEKVLRYRIKADKYGEKWSLLKSSSVKDKKGHVLFVVNEFQDITSIKLAEQKLRFLSEASKILSSSLDYKKTLSSVANLAVSNIADWCVLDILEDGQIKEIAIAHKDSKKIKWARAYRKMYPPDINSQFGVAGVIKSKLAKIYPVITEKVLKKTIKLKAQLNLLKKVGFTSVMIVPLKIGLNGVGAISFISAESKRIYTKSDLDLAIQLASRASLAIENSRLYQNVEKQRVRLNNIVANVPGIVWESFGNPSHKNQNIEYVSDYVEKMLGYTVEKWLSTPNFWLKIVHPEDKERAAREAVEIYRSGKGGVSQFRWLTKTGTAVWVEAHSVVVKDDRGNAIGMRGVAMDIGERKQMEFVNQKLAKIVESSDDAIISITLDGKITTWNSGAEKLYGYSAREMVGKDTIAIIPIHKRQELQDMREVLRLGESIDRLETQRKHKDGRIIDVSVSVSPIKEPSGKVTELSSITRDITASKELERRKDAFISMASHELKTPVTSIRAYIQLLKSRFSTINDESVKKFLDRTDEQIDQLTDLVNDLLDLSKIQVGKLELNKEKFDLGELTEETIENMQGISFGHQILLEGFTNISIVADRIRIGQVLINIINNAIKYSPEADKIIVKIINKGNKVIVGIKDFGIGISRTHQKRIFDRFYRAAGASEKTFPGLGIGLYISSEIIKRHGGNIWVDSVKRQGTTFYFSLPLK